MYLIDTDVLSTTRRLAAEHSVVAWLRVQAPGLFLSTISVMEIERGIEKQRGVDPPFARDLESWLLSVLAAFDGRILPLTVSIAQRWGCMQLQLGRADFDVALAATALEHGLHVVTRNVRHFDKTGASVIDPFEATL